eukprot:TRINITY_DN4315_c0_g1_i1.p1 TRINITY_DN4315_c0_g1~~TRINITY_DN4315_c0_g1_i1.p1  ORF type:complete len:563 (+),score=134.46 TRINITY_DN4315_c0_g1_i1:8-1696(+)
MFSFIFSLIISLLKWFSYFCLFLIISVIIICLIYKYLERKHSNKLKKIVDDYKKAGNTLPKICIIGGGFGGIITGIKLKEIGIKDFIIIEKNTTIGGTWKDNIYPGSGCDIPSYLYSVSFFQKLDWSRWWAKQSEILDYMNEIVEHFGLMKYFKFEHEIIEAVYNQESKKWRINVIVKDDQEVVLDGFDYLISGMGQLNIPSFPNIEGLDEFKGELFHSARWNTDYDLSNKRVAVIGSGATAIQCVPEIAKQVKELYIFQRSPHYVGTKPDGPVPSFITFAFKYIPFVALLYRWKLYWQYELNWPAFRKKGKINKLAYRLFTGQMKKSFQRDGKTADEIKKIDEMWDTVLPKSIVGCKRVLISNEWYNTLFQDHVELVTTHIQNISGDSINLKDGSSVNDLDAIILCTGFKTTEFLYPINFYVEDKDGNILHDLQNQWKDTGAQAYYGITVNNFPNFFILYGPNTNLGHNSIIFMLETQVHYIVNLVSIMLKNQNKTIEIKEDVLTKYNDDISKILNRTVFAADCNSWYKKNNRIVNNLPFCTFWYWKLLNKINLNEFKFSK